MKITILIVLLGIAALLLTILYMLFQPGHSYQAAQPTLRSKQAAVGRAVLEAAKHDPAVAAMVQAAVRVAPDEDRVLANDLIPPLHER